MFHILEDMASTLEMYEAMVDYVEDGVAWRALGELETMNDKLQKARRANEYLQRKIAEKFGFPYVSRSGHECCTEFIQMNRSRLPAQTPTSEGRMFASDK